MPLPKNTVGGEHSRADARAHARVIFNGIIPLPRRKSRCGGNYSPPPCEGIISSRSRVAIRACSSPCAVPRRAARLSRGRSLSLSLRVVGVLYPHTPTLLLYPSFLHSFCQGIAPKNFAGTACKIFRALDNGSKLKSKHARSGSPPRALIAQLRPSIYHLRLVF